LSGEVIRWRGPVPALSCSTGGVFAESRPLFSSNWNWNTWSVPRCGTNAKRLVLSVMIACALRAVGITCAGAPIVPSGFTGLTLTRFAP